MKRVIALLALLPAGMSCVGTSLAQSSPVTENAASSYVASAFITGAAPAILSEAVEVGPALREHLALSQHPDRDTVYRALFALTEGKTIHVVSGPHELSRFDRAALLVEAGDDVRFVVQYDLRANNVAFVGLPRSVSAGSASAEPQAKALKVAAVASITALPTAVALQPVLFEFDHATLSESARALLDDELARRLRTAARILVTGYADPLGTSEYNLGLSWQRAEAVRERLIALGVAPSRIQVAAAGNGPADRCAGEPTRRARIACLAPERRVELEVELPPR
jgi:outer membrane protein OmpA-like peptidoglycan-associated protein